MGPAMQRFWHVTVPELYIHYHCLPGLQRFKAFWYLCSPRRYQSQLRTGCHLHLEMGLYETGRDADLGYASALGIIYSRS